MKKYLFLLVCWLGTLPLAQAQPNTNIISWKARYSHYTYLMQEMHKQYLVRDSDFNSALLSPAKMAEYTSKLRGNAKKAVGELPQKTPLNAQITGTIQAESFRIEKLVLESRPNFHLSCNLYLPQQSSEKKPAVLLFCGHEMTSKATESYQKTALLFVKNGFVVLAIDPVSQSERMQIVDSVGKPFTKSSTNEHTMLNAGCNLVGTSIAAYELYDNIRALDYLCTRSEVDTTRMGCLGNSGGGTQTVYFIANDPRMKVAAPCSFVAKRERNFELTYAADGCQHLMGEGHYGLEIGDFLIAFAPKPLLLLAARFDFVDYTGTEMVAKELSKVYALQNCAEKFKLFTFDDGHGISQPKREAAVSWFRKWLCNDSSKVMEENISVQNENTLKCVEQGQVLQQFAHETNISQINLSMAKQWEKDRKAFLQSDQKIIEAKVAELLGLDVSKPSIQAEIIDKKKLSGYLQTKLIIRSKGEIPFPCLVYEPLETNSRTQIEIILDENGKAAAVKDSLNILQQCKNNTLIFVPDLSGVGEMADLSDCNDPKYWNKEYRCAMASLHIGKTVVGQRVSDLLRLIQYTKENPNVNKTNISIKANGLYVPVALHAAVFSKDISQIKLPEHYHSYLNWIEKPTEKDAYSYLVPNVLRYYDLPDLRQWLLKNKAIRFISDH